MASPFTRGLVRTGRPLKRPWTMHVARALGRPGATNAAGLVAQRWAGRRGGLCSCQRRKLHDDQRAMGGDRQKQSLKSLPVNMNDFKKYFDIPPQSPSEDFQKGNTVTVHGYISKRRDLSQKMAFVDLLMDDAPAFQFLSSWEEPDSPEHKLHQALKSLPAWSPVALTGTIDKFKSIKPGDFALNFPRERDEYELTLRAVHLLNPFPRDIIVSEGALFPPKSRHLQLKFDKLLQNRLKIRHGLTHQAHRSLMASGFTLVETPILFKSTPEGAREFLVPTRRPGYAYALPQSPQQYKQILMASGVKKYFQFARCFRDEDLRADRQPEFTQLDLELSFSTGKDVMALVERIVWDIYRWLRENWRVTEINGQLAPIPLRCGRSDENDDDDTVNHSNQYSKIGEHEDEPFPRITYQEAMSLYGSDKPDLRISNNIQRIDSFLAPGFTSMITDLQDPIVEACVFRFQESSNLSPEGESEEHVDDIPQAVIPKSNIQDFVKSTWDTLPKPLRTNPDGQPVPMVLDSSKPLSGLSPLGHEAASWFLESGQLEEGDLLVIQARPNAPFSGGSTALGTLRKHIYDAAVAARLLPHDPSFRFLWVTDFPLFTPTEAGSTDPGQGGAAGFSSTHHPFTAPLTPEDFDLMATDPLKARADHYDLVVNGVELGGGSRRIHVAAVQEYVFREVLQMRDEGIEHFRHLLEALRAGCPPHAGFAFGWDRLVATLTYTGSVRDVIAFPKSKKGEEPVARVPGKVGEEEWGVYHLQPKKKGE